jgi:hypothetical protein
VHPAALEGAARAVVLALAPPEPGSAARSVLAPRRARESDRATGALRLRPSPAYRPRRHAGGAACALLGRVLAACGHGSGGSRCRRGAHRAARRRPHPLARGHQGAAPGRSPSGGCHSSRAVQRVPTRRPRTPRLPRSGVRTPSRPPVAGAPAGRYPRPTGSLRWTVPQRRGCPPAEECLAGRVFSGSPPRALIDKDGLAPDLTPPAISPRDERRPDGWALSLNWR